MLGALLLQVIVMAIGGWMAFHGIITIGTFASFQALFVTLSQLPSAISRRIRRHWSPRYPARGGAHGRIAPNEPSRITAPSGRAQSSRHRNRSNSSPDVSFAYPGRATESRPCQLLDPPRHIRSILPRRQWLRQVAPCAQPASASLPTRSRRRRASDRWSGPARRLSRFLPPANRRRFPGQLSVQHEHPRKHSS